MAKKELVKKARDMINKANPTELGELTVNEIARRLNVNRSTLSRAFSSLHPGKTLQKYLQKSKMAAFDKLIQQGDAQTVNEALNILDIRDPGHFIKKYKAHKGLTPGEAIKHKKKKNKNVKNK